MPDLQSCLWAVQETGRKYAELDPPQQAGLQARLQEEMRANTYDEATGAVSFEEAGVAFSATTIDFSKSRWMNPTLLVGGLAVNANSNKNDDVWNTGYAIETGNPSEPIVLTFNEQQMRVFGRAEVKMFGLVSMTGVLVALAILSAVGGFFSIPHFLEQMDDRYWRNRSWTALPIDKPPSSYWYSNMSATLAVKAGSVCSRATSYSSL